MLLTRLVETSAKQGGLIDLLYLLLHAHPISGCWLAWTKQTWGWVPDLTFFLLLLYPVVFFFYLFCFLSFHFVFVFAAQLFLHIRNLCARRFLVFRPLPHAPFLALDLADRFSGKKIETIHFYYRLTLPRRQSGGIEHTPWNAVVCQSSTSASAVPVLLPIELVS